MHLVGFTIGISSLSLEFRNCKAIYRPLLGRIQRQIFIQISDLSRRVICKQTGKKHGEAAVSPCSLSLPTYWQINKLFPPLYDSFSSTTANTKGMDKVYRLEWWVEVEGSAGYSYDGKNLTSVYTCMSY